MPPSPWPVLDAPGVLAFAHRGAHGTRPGEAAENTMAAFAAAVDLGYRYVETDVHVTADGVVLAFHDDHLDRVTDMRGAIGELAWEVVRQARVGGPGGGTDGGSGGEGIPLLEDLLGTWPELRVNIDAKHDAAVEPLVEVLQRTASLDRVCVAAFSDARLHRLRKALGPSVCTSLGPVGTAKLRAASVGAPVGALAAACAQVPVRSNGVTLVDRRFVAAAHRRGLQVHVWTIDERAEMERLLDLGVDGLMTDAPSMLKDVLEARGLW